MTPLQEARAPKTPPARLRALSQRSAELAIAVLENPSTPPELAAEIRTRLLPSKRRRTPEETDEFLFAPLRQEASSPETLPARLEALSRLHPSLAVLVAQNPSAPPKLLESLIDHPDPLVVCGVIQNPKATPEALSRASRSSKRCVKRALASCPRTPPEILTHLGGSYQGNDVHRDIAKNPALSLDALFFLWTSRARKLVRLAVQMIQKENDERLTIIQPFIRALRRHYAGGASAPPFPGSLAPQDLELFFFASLSPSEQYTAAQRTDTTPALLRWLSKREDPTVRSYVARNPSLPKELYPNLAADKVDFVRTSFASNRNVTPDILASLSQDRAVDVRRYVGWHQNTPPETLARLAMDKNLNVRIAVALNPNTPPNALLRLSQNKTSDGLAVLQNGSFPEEALRKIVMERSLIIGRSRLESQQKAIASRVALSPELLLLLAEHPKASIQQIIAQRPNLTPEVLSTLATSPHREVRALVASRAQRPT